MDIPIIGEPPEGYSRMTCRTCFRAVEVPNAKFDIINTETVSMIVWSRGPAEVKCDCGQKYIGVIAGFGPQGIVAQYQPVPTKSKEHIQ